VIDLLRSPFYGVALLLVTCTAAAASHADCPPGDWFCEPVPPPSSQPDSPEMTPQPGPEQPRPELLPPGPSRAPMELEYFPPPPGHHQLQPKVWAIRTQFLLPFVDRHAASNYGMAGLGVGGRARPDAAVALDLGLKTFGGVDYLGHRRNELALDFTTTVFFNPHDVVQAFVLAGLGWSRADVSYKTHVTTATGSTRVQMNQTYNYFGLLAGLGVEWRIEPRWSLDFALIGMLRGRTDSNADNNPEFIDPRTQLATNSSGAGMLSLGLNYYF